MAAEIFYPESSTGREMLGFICGVFLVGELVMLIGLVLSYFINKWKHHIDLRFLRRQGEAFSLLRGGFATAAVIVAVAVFMQQQRGAPHTAAYTPASTTSTTTLAGSPCPSATALDTPMLDIVSSLQADLQRPRAKDDELDTQLATFVASTLAVSAHTNAIAGALSTVRQSTLQYIDALASNRHPEVATLHAQVAQGLKNARQRVGKCEEERQGVRNGELRAALDRFEVTIAEERGRRNGTRRRTGQERPLGDLTGEGLDNAGALIAEARKKVAAIEDAVSDTCAAPLLHALEGALEEKQGLRRLRALRKIVLGTA